jgi:L-asparaginase
MKTHFIITGGTIDSYYEGTKDTVVTNKKTVIPRFIKSLKLYTKTIFSEICMKDSRSLTKEDLKKILQAIENSDCTKIIITHGTYTMPDTARYLQANLKREDQTIIITGSMIPLVGFSPSDAPFNLGYALSEVAHLKPGVTLCMNARIFSPDEVLKTLYEGRFSSIFGEL